MGKNISIYLSDENLQYLDQICKAWKMGRSATIQYLVDYIRKMAPILFQIMKETQSPLAENLAKVFPELEKGVKP